MNTLTDITKTTVKLLIKEPFYGHFFTYIQRNISTKVSRVGLRLNDDGGLHLLVNPTFWESLTADQKFGSIKHQILHLVFRHIYQLEKFGAQQLFYMASDLVVNQYLTTSQLAPEAWVIEDFPFLNLKPKQSVYYYYERLKSLSGLERMKLLNEKGEGSEEDAGDGDPLSEHKDWDSFDQQSGAQQKFIEEKIDTYAAQSASRLSKKDFGLLPLALQLNIQEAEKRLNPVTNWKRVLRLYLNTSKKTYVKSTLKRPSRRYGTIPGTHIKHHQKVMVAIDTSGSVSEEALGHFFSEIHHIWKQSAEIEVLECDTDIHAKYCYKGVTPAIVGGRGGTAFDPPIAYANQQRPDVLIYFTDGYAPPPKLTSRCPIIWVLTADSSSPNRWHNFPGRKLMLGKEVQELV